MLKLDGALALVGECRSLEALTVGVKSHVTFFRRKERRSATSIELLAIDGAVNCNTNQTPRLAGLDMFRLTEESALASRS